MTMTRRALGSLLAALPFLKASKAKAIEGDEWSPVTETRWPFSENIVQRFTETRRGHLTIGIEQEQADGHPPGPAIMYACNIIARPSFFTSIWHCDSIEEAKRHAPSAWTPDEYLLTTVQGALRIPPDEARGMYLKALKWDKSATLTVWTDIPSPSHELRLDIGTRWSGVPLRPTVSELRSFMIRKHQDAQAALAEMGK